MKSKRQLEDAVVRAAMRQQELLNMKPVPADEWVKAEAELEKACAKLSALNEKE